MEITVCPEGKNSVYIHIFIYILKRNSLYYKIEWFNIGVFVSFFYYFVTIYIAYYLKS